MRRLDSGSEPFFGDFTVVFNSHLAKAVAAWNLAAMVLPCIPLLGQRLCPGKKTFSLPSASMYINMHTHAHTHTDIL